ncbi:MAG: hypothetical protein ACRDHP_18390, partial [Ktedonobacterales bacterium]
QYGYPQGQPMGPGYPGMAPVPAPTRGRNTGIIIGAIVLVIVIVGALVLHSLGGTSFAGQWYGQVKYTPAAGTTFSPYTAEVYLDLAQNSSNTLSGTGKLCVNLNGSPQEVSFTVTGTANGSNANIKVATSSGTAADAASLSGGNMSFNSTDNTGTTVG